MNVKVFKSDATPAEKASVNLTILKNNIAEFDIPTLPKDTVDIVTDPKGVATVKD